MSEALTPKLTRDQYRDGYLRYIGKEIANEAYNLSAVEAYNTQGESLEDSINQSATLTQGIPLATLKAVNAVKFRATVENATAAIHPLNLKTQQFIYTASDAINQILRSGYMGTGRGRVTPQIFRQVVSDMMRGAMNQVPQINNFLIPQGSTKETQTSPVSVDATVLENNGPSSNTTRSSSPATRSSSPARDFRGTVTNSGVSTPSFVSVTSNPLNRSRSPSIASRASSAAELSIEDLENMDVESLRNHARNTLNMGRQITHNIRKDTIMKKIKEQKLARSQNEPSGGLFASGRSVRVDLTPRQLQTLSGMGLIGRSSVSEGLESRYQRSIRGSGLKDKATPLVRFGNYLIDTNELGKNQLSLYTAKGNKQRKIPKSVIGGNVTNVIKSFVSGQRPAPKDILSLSEDERDYLNGVGMAAKIEDLQEMPTKKKTEMQKDMHEFEVLRGQIAAGNDNKELVQDFKKKLLKMIQAKKVSKAQGHDLLLELAAMGI